jgi:hypothetical protein
MKESINKLKSLILHLEKITNSTSVKDIQRLRATGSDLTSTSKIITMMWKLNGEISKRNYKKDINEIKISGYNDSIYHKALKKYLKLGGDKNELIQN